VTLFCRRAPIAAVPHALPTVRPRRSGRMQRPTRFAGIELAIYHAGEAWAGRILSCLKAQAGCASEDPDAVCDPLGGPPGRVPARRRATS